MDETKHRHVCDCGEVYWSLAAIESCQMNNHGRPKADKMQAQIAALTEALNDAEQVLTKWRRYLPTHGTYAEEAINDWEGAQHKARAALGKQGE